MKELVETVKIETLSEGEISKLLTDSGYTLLSPFIDKYILEKLLIALEFRIKERWPISDETDPNTEKGRKTLISRARSIASVSVRLDDIGKQEVAKLKELPKKVDDGRRQAREFFENWKQTVREPVAKWEVKQAEVMKLAQVILDHEQALLDHEIWQKEEDSRRLARQFADEVRQEQERLKQKEYEEKLKEELTKEIKQEVSQELLNSYICINDDYALEREKLVELVPKPLDNNNKGEFRQLCLFIMDETGLTYDLALKLIYAIKEGKTPYLKIVYKAV